MAQGSAPANPRRRSLPLIAPDDCTTCGACCFSEDPSYIEVFGADRNRMDSVALALTVTRDDRHFMRFASGRCEALRSEGGRLLCSIYAQRPDACRWLERGSGMCLDVLAAGS